MSKSKSGFTLIEMLVVISILALLVIASMFSVKSQRDKAEDARTKSDLNRLKIAFEDYYNDNNCYPPAEWFDSPDDCGSNELAPYLNFMPCDQKTGNPYVLETDPTTCEWFKLYATFNLPNSDPDAIAQRSPSGSTNGNYGVASSNVVVSVFYDDSTVSPTPSPSPTPIPSPDMTKPYYCNSYSNCSSINFGIFISCSPAYADPFCSNQCTTTVGTCIPR